MLVIPGQRLTAQPDLSLIFRSWLSGHPDLGHATSDWRTFLVGGASTDASAAAPAWRDSGWRELWLAELLADLPNTAARERARLNVDRLVRGEAAVVITGQQPGLLGGPLYTFLKAADPDVSMDSASINLPGDSSDLVSCEPAPAAVAWMIPRRTPPDIPLWTQRWLI